MGVWKGMCWDRVLKNECGWVNTMEFCLGGNWICARDGTWRFPGQFLIWILVGKCSGVFCWKITYGPWLGDLYKPVVEEFNGK